jgi:hypothetical protein
MEMLSFDMACFLLRMDGSDILGDWPCLTGDGFLELGRGKAGLRLLPTDVVCNPGKEEEPGRFTET